jgi:hypothetical protein
MRETELKILFPTEKLDALRFFMGKKELDVEQELKDYLIKLMKKLFRHTSENMWKASLTKHRCKRKRLNRELRSSSRSHKGNASQDKPAASVSRRWLNQHHYLRRPGSRSCRKNRKNPRA